jgi:glycosyltransferase involved in cell wall biosynthesis
MKKMTLAIVGIAGLPNNYGGFETLADYLVENLSRDIDITVYCSSVDMKTRLGTYKGASLKYIPFTSHGSFGIMYDSIALFKAVFKHDKVLFLGFGGGFVIPFLRKYKSKIILNIGGLDWKRDKWSPFAKRVIKAAEGLLVKNSGHVISDNIGIQNYLLEEYGKESMLIAYGGDQANKQLVPDSLLEAYAFLKSEYAFSVTRIQSDNNIEMILDAFSQHDTMPLVMVGNWQNSGYGKSMRMKYRNNENLILLDAIYDREKLDILRSNCTLYVHGHSAGGTNPSLVEAMYLGLPIFAFASGYNEYTTENKALYFQDVDQLTDLVRKYNSLDLSSLGKEMKKIAEISYRWSNIAIKYHDVFTSAMVPSNLQDLREVQANNVNPSVQSGAIRSNHHITISSLSSSLKSLLPTLQNKRIEKV